MNDREDQQFDPEDRERLIEYVVLREKLVLILRDTRLELHEIKAKGDFYIRKLVWYTHIGESAVRGIQGLDVQHQSQILSRVLIVINNVIYILLIGLSSRGFKRCTVVIKHKVVDHPNQEVHDAKFYKDMDLVYTLRYKDLSLVQDIEKVNQFVYLLETQNLRVGVRGALPQSNKLPTKNCGSEPMTISFTANYLHMVLHTKTAIQMLLISPYSTEKKLIEKGISLMLDQSVSKKTTEEKQKIRCLHNRKVTQKVLSTFKNKSKAEKSRESEQIEIQLELEEETEENVRQFSFYKRFEDSLLFDFKFDKQIRVARKKQRQNSRNPESHIYSRPVQQLTFITEVFSSNMHDKDKIVFVAEGGVNPALKIISCVPSGPKLVEFFTYTTLFKLEHDVKYTQKELTRTFGYLRGKLVNVYQSRSDLKNHLEEVYHEEGKGDKRVRWFHLYERVTIFDYIIFFYCAEDDDALIAMTIRISLEEFYKVKVEGALEETQLRDNPKNFPRKGNLVYIHKVSDAKREVIRQFSRTQLNQLDVEIHPRPWEVMWGNMFSSMRFDIPNVRSLKWMIKEPDRGDKFATLIKLPELPKFESEFFWVDQNWFFKQVRASTVIQGGQSVINFKVTSRDKDEAVMNQIDEYLARLKYRKKLEKESQERGRSPIVAEVGRRHQPPAEPIAEDENEQREDFNERRDRGEESMQEDRRNRHGRTDTVRGGFNRQRNQRRDRDMEDEWSEKSINQSNQDISVEDGHVADQTFGNDTSFQSQSNYNHNMESSGNRGSWGGSTKRRGRGKTYQQDQSYRERKEPARIDGILVNGSLSKDEEDYFAVESKKVPETPFDEAAFKKPNLELEEVSFQNETFGDGQIYPEGTNGYPYDEISFQDGNRFTQSNHQNGNSRSTYNSTKDSSFYGDKYRSNRDDRGNSERDYHQTRGGNSDRRLGNRDDRDSYGRDHRQRRGGNPDSYRGGQIGRGGKRRAVLHPMGRTHDDYDSYMDKNDHNSSRHGDSYSNNSRQEGGYGSDFTFGQQNDSKDMAFYDDESNESWRHKKHAGKRVEVEDLEEEPYEFDSGLSRANDTAYSQKNPKVAFVKKDYDQQVSGDGDRRGRRGRGGHYRGSSGSGGGQEFSSRSYQNEANRRREELKYRDEQARFEEESSFCLTLERIADAQRRHEEKWG